MDEIKNNVRKDDKIYFYLPDFYYKFQLNCILIAMKEKYPEVFFDNIEIGAVYGCFPTSIWNGGRLMFGQCHSEQIQEILQFFNDRNIACRYTFTNPLIEDKHLNDTFCNMCLELGDNGKNEVLVNSPILEQYIRNNYPGYKILSSTTKGLKSKDAVKKETAKDYSLVVLDYTWNNTGKLFELNDKDRYELLVNAYCLDNCPNRQDHYKNIGRIQLAYSDESTYENCASIDRNFYDIQENKSFIKVEDIYGRYYDAGFRHFKIEGRTNNGFDVLESYMYYMIKPEYRDVARLTIAKEIASFNV